MLGDEIGFHDASLVKIESGQSFIRISIEDAFQADGSKVSGDLKVTGVKKIYAEDTPVSAFEMASADGEILDLEFADGELSLIVQWNDFANRASTTRHYRVLYESVDWWPRNAIGRVE